MNNKHYQTERLILRPWYESDKAEFARINSDIRVMEFFPEQYTEERSHQMVAECTRRLAKDGFTFWALERKDSNTFIGFVGLTTFEADLPFSPCVEIGWRLAFEHWGQGFATEAARFCLTLGFTEFSLEKIVSFTALANTRSRRVMESIGMIDTAKNFLHPSVDSASGLQEHCLYEVINCELSVNED